MVIYRAAHFKALLGLTSGGSTMAHGVCYGLVCVYLCFVGTWYEKHQRRDDAMERPTASRQARALSGIEHLPWQLCAKVLRKLSGRFQFCRFRLGIQKFFMSACQGSRLSRNARVTIVWQSRCWRPRCNEWRVHNMLMPSFAV